MTRGCALWHVVPSLVVEGQTGTDRGHVLPLAANLQSLPRGVGCRRLTFVLKVSIWINCQILEKTAIEAH